jgi:hypothetical protein
MNIYSDFKPTFLYIKQHTKTGKLYFGKTVKPDPVSYSGSGTYWNLHLKKHGKHLVETVWYCLFTDKDELVKFALAFSEQEHIDTSDSWANLIKENGLDGNTPGSKTPEDVRKRISLSNIGVIRNEEWKQKQSAAFKGRKMLPEHALKIRTTKNNLSAEQKLADSKKQSLAQSKRCTVDGITIFDSAKDLAAALGQGKNGYKSKSFRFI